jgi:ADP-ribose pyrophosphatase YjhB (NUDIX family)
MKFCSECAAPVVVKIPEGDHLPRFVCERCGTVHYQNPRLVVGCVPVLEDGRILICRRAIEPRHGFWTVPAGFMENGETLQQGAAREALEEALADVEIGSLLVMAHVLHARQVHVFFRARLRSPTVGAGPESLEVRFVTPAEIPWGELAFATTEFALRRYLEDLAAGVEPHHFAEFDRRPPA